MRKYARILVPGHNLFLEAHSFPRKTVRILEQIMSADKYPGIIPRQIEAIVSYFKFTSTTFQTVKFELEIV